MDHMHLLKLDDLRGMDGAPDVLRKQIEEIGNELLTEGYVTAGDGVDAALALALIDSKGDPYELLAHVSYILNQLNIVRINLKARCL